MKYEYTLSVVITDATQAEAIRSIIGTRTAHVWLDDPTADEVIKAIKYAVDIGIQWIVIRRPWDFFL